MSDSQARDITMADAALPPEWTEHEHSGRKYYYNSVTKETSWERPTATPAAITPLSPVSAPESSFNNIAIPSSPTSSAHAHVRKGNVWQEGVDSSSGRKYYFNNQTGETSWVEPEELKRQRAPSVIKSLDDSSIQKKLQRGHSTPNLIPVSIHKTPVVEESPEDWVEAVEQASGRTYFFNKKTKESSWLRPAILAEQAPQQQEEPSQPHDEHNDLKRHQSMAGLRHHLHAKKELSLPEIPDPTPIEAPPSSLVNELASAPAKDRKTVMLAQVSTPSPSAPASFSGVKIEALQSPKELPKLADGKINLANYAAKNLIPIKKGALIKTVVKPEKVVLWQRFVVVIICFCVDQ